jgi:hypothetical protein
MATREYYDFILRKRKILLSFHKSLLFVPPLFPHPLSCSSSSFIPWLSHYDMRCCGDRWKGGMSAYFAERNAA